MIPSILHQTSESAALPEPLAGYTRSWRRLNPGMRHQFFDNHARRKFVGEIFPDYLGVYDGFRFGIQQADFFRYLAVYHFGGLYCDTDMECLQPFDRFLAMEGMVLGVEAHLTARRQRELAYRHPVQIANCIFAAEPRHPFLLKLIERIVGLVARHPSQTVAEVEDITGPRMLTRLFFDTQPADVTVLEQVYWMAPSYYGRMPGLRPNVFACHHFLGSWKDRGARPSLSRKLIELNLPPWPFPNRMARKFL